MFKVAYMIFFLSGKAEIAVPQRSYVSCKHQVELLTPVLKEDVTLRCVQIPEKVKI